MYSMRGEQYSGYISISEGQPCNERQRERVKDRDRERARARAREREREQERERERERAIRGREQRKEIEKRLQGSGFLYIRWKGGDKKA
jgi:hypothetical protein